MDRAALQKLKRADVQKLAKRDGVKGNSKTAQIIEDLLQKHHPLLVPYMDSIPPTTEQEAISRKILRRQGMTMLAPASDSGSARRSPRRARVNVEPIAGPSQTPESASVGPVPAPREQVEPRADKASSAKTQNARCSAKASIVSQEGVARARAGSSHNRALLRAETHSAQLAQQASQSPSKSSTRSPRPSSPRRPGLAALEKTDGAQRTLGVFGLGPLKLWSPPRNGEHTGGDGEPVRPPRVFFPPTEVQRAEMRTKAAQGTLPPDRLPLSRAPVFTRPMPVETRPRRVDLSQQDEQPIPERVMTRSSDMRGISQGSDTDGEAARSEVLPPAAAPAVHLPTISELRDALQEIAPLADGDEDVREGLRELGILVNVVEQRNEAVKRRVREAQKLRLALEQHFFARLKDHPRLTDGSRAWTRGESGDDATDEEDLEEVEELTSREVLHSDIPDGMRDPEEDQVATRSSCKGSGKRPADDLDAEEDAYPTKRRRSKV
ncbi:hypothetical protein BV20DRAFT_1123160 [Pilatotrama ljubarskyi]|nr:hypothetical protein BV20DRAFT_1123160 [Pilatotrama ljubarskyi]